MEDRETLCLVCVCLLQDFILDMESEFGGFWLL